MSYPWNTIRPGDHLVICDESGLTDWASNMMKRWDGAFVRKSGWETRHPQDFVKARNDPYPLKDVRPQTPSAAVSNTPSATVGQTSVATKTSPAHHLFS